MMARQLIRFCRKAFPKNEIFSAYLAGKLRQIRVSRQVAERFVLHVCSAVPGEHRYVNPSDIIRLGVDGNDVPCLRLLHDVRRYEQTLFNAFVRVCDDLKQIASSGTGYGVSVLPLGKVEPLSQLALVAIVMLAGCPFFPSNNKKHVC